MYVLTYLDCIPVLFHSTGSKDPPWEQYKITPAPGSARTPATSGRQQYDMFSIMIMNYNIDNKFMILQLYPGHSELLQPLNDSSSNHKNNKSYH